jgi:large repetitive protein
MKRGFWICLLLVVAGSITAQGAVISGVVSDSASKPLKNIWVALRTTTTAAGATILKDTTDSAGAYSFSCDSIGKYTLRTSDLAVPAGYTLQYDTLTLDGAAKTLNIKMAAIIKASLTGTVTDSASGTAIAGAIVRSGAKIDTTGADGKYAIDTVTTGATITVSMAGYVGKTVAVSVTSTAVTADVALVKTKYLKLSGIVTDSVAAAPIAGAIVRYGTTATKRDTTGTDGAYALDSVLAGSAITVSATGYVSKTATIPVGDSTATVSVALVKVKYGSIVGTITDSASAAAIAGAIVRIGVKLDTTAADGKYALDSLTPGTASMSVNAKGYTTRTMSITAIADSSSIVDVKLVAVIYSSISGTVTDSATGTPIAGAIVSAALKTGFSSKSDTTGADGSFVIDSIGVGAYGLTTSLTRYVTKIDSVVLSDTARKTVAVKLSAIPYFAVSGKVVDSAAGTPLSGVVVLLRGTSGTASVTLDSVVTDSLGQYSLDSAYTGTRLKVYIAGYDTVRVQLTGATSTAQTIQVKLMKKVLGVKAMIGVQEKMTLTIANNHLLFRSAVNAGTIRLMNVKGELIGLRSFPAGATVNMELGGRLSAGTYIVSISQKTGVLTKRVMVK